MQITFELDISGVKVFTDSIDRFAAELPGAAARALNRSADQATTAMGRQLADETGLGVRDVHDTFEIEHGDMSDFSYHLRIPGRQTRLSEFAPRETRKGISARPWGQRRVFPGTFEIPGRDDVFHRTTRARYRIEPLFGPNLAVEAMRGDTLQVGADTFCEAFARRMQHEIGRLWSKKGGGED